MATKSAAGTATCTVRSPLRGPAKAPAPAVYAAQASQDISSLPRQLLTNSTITLWAVRLCPPRKTSNPLPHVAPHSVGHTTALSTAQPTSRPSEPGLRDCVPCRCARARAHRRAQSGCLALGSHASKRGAPRNSQQRARARGARIVQSTSTANSMPIASRLSPLAVHAPRITRPKVARRWPPRAAKERGHRPSDARCPPAAREAREAREARQARQAVAAREWLPVEGCLLRLRHRPRKPRARRELRTRREPLIGLQKRARQRWRWPRLWEEQP